MCFSATVVSEKRHSARADWMRQMAYQFCEDIGESTCNVRVVLDLVEARLDIIGVGNVVVVWVCNMEVVHADEYVLSYHAKFTLELGAVRC
jgi:hypothetical protein